MSDPVRVQNVGAVTTITIDRTEARNALNLDALKALLSALETSQTSSTRVVVLTGAGGSFSAGGDIQDMLARRGQAVATFERLRAGLAKLVELITRHPKPVLARVEGDAVGAGCALALACDFLLASETARLGFPFVKMGLIPDTGSSWMVPHIVGLQQARRLLLTGDLVTATEAMGLGLVTEVARDAKALDGRVAAWTDKLAQLPTTAFSDGKRLLYQSVHQSLSNSVLNEAILQGIRFTTDEHAKAVDAFLARKKG